jgi:hypothetical protein
MRFVTQSRGQMVGAHHEPPTSSRPTHGISSSPSGKINRKPELLEPPVSCRKQRTAPQINRKLSPASCFRIFHSPKPPVAALENVPEIAAVRWSRGIPNQPPPLPEFLNFLFLLSFLHVLFSNRDGSTIRISRNLLKTNGLTISNRYKSHVFVASKNGFPTPYTLAPTCCLSTSARPVKFRRARALRACDDGFAFNANLFKEIEPDGCE